MEKITIHINGKTVVTSQDKSILETALENGIHIPTLCYHPSLKPAGACRICIVEEENSGRILASCVTPVSKGMSILTHSPQVIEHRRNIVSLMIANHPESCILCNKGNRCELRKIASELGIGAINLYPMPQWTGFEQGNEFIERDLSKCILCGRCIRADHDLVVVGAIDYNMRGFKSRPATLHNQPFEKSNCTFCGTCVSLCPTGALSIKSLSHEGSFQKEAPGICGYCGVGCSISIGIFDGKMCEINPSHRKGTPNGSTLCVRGHFANDFLNSQQRLTTPFIRENDQLNPSTWDNAIELIAKELLSIKERYGPQSIGFIGSTRCSNEEDYLFQKIARAVIKTNNIDNTGYLNGRLYLLDFILNFRNHLPCPSINSIERSEVLLVIGGDPTISHPVVGYHIKRAKRFNSSSVIFMSPYISELTFHSSLMIPALPGHEYHVLEAISNELIKSDGIREDFIKNRTSGFDDYKKSLDEMKIHQLKGGESYQSYINQATNLVKGKSITAIIQSGLLRQVNANKTLSAIINLLLLTGSINNGNSGLLILTDTNNENGALDMGTTPEFLPGPIPLFDNEGRKRFEYTWNVTISPDPGLNLFKMIEEAEKGNLKALYIMGENPLKALPQKSKVIHALRKLNFLVVQDILMNEIGEIAHVVLPGSAFCEKDGSFTNTERRVRCFQKAITPPGDGRADWEILSMLMEKFGLKPYKSIEHVRDEISSLVPAYRYISDKTSEFIISSEMPENIPFTPYAGLNESGKYQDYPFIAVISDEPLMAGSGTRVNNSYRISRVKKEPTVDISEKDAEDLGLKTGDSVLISSRFNSIQRKVVTNNRLPQGLVVINPNIIIRDEMELFPLFSYESKDFMGLKNINVKLKKA